MNSDFPSVSYETTLDEIADVQFRYLMHTRVGRAGRRNEALTVGGATAAAFMGAIRFQSGPLPLSVAAVLIAVGVAFGLCTASLLWLSYEGRVRRRLRKLLYEELGPGPFACEIELTPEGVNTRQPQVNITNVWRDLTDMKDVDAGIELRFRGGYVLVRTRAFGTSSDRATFLERARTLSASVPA